MSGEKKTAKKDGVPPGGGAVESKLQQEEEEMREADEFQAAKDAGFDALRKYHAARQRRQYLAQVAAEEAEQWPLLSAAERVTLKKRLGPGPSHPCPRRTVRGYKSTNKVDIDHDAALQQFERRKADLYQSMLEAKLHPEEHEDDTSGGGAVALAKKADAGGPSVGSKRKQAGVSGASGKKNRPVVTTRQRVAASAKRKRAPGTPEPKPQPMPQPMPQPQSQPQPQPQPQPQRMSVVAATCGKASCVLHTVIFLLLLYIMCARP